MIIPQFDVHNATLMISSPFFDDSAYFFYQMELSVYKNHLFAQFLPMHGNEGGGVVCGGPIICTSEVKMTKILLPEESRT